MMRAKDFRLMHEDVSVDDFTLIKLSKKLNSVKLEKKRIFEDTLESFSDDEYINIVLARLAYNFAKEEHDNLVQEIRKRGLETIG